MVTLPQPPGMSEHAPELASTPIQPQELQECGLYELRHGSSIAYELPPVPIEPGGPVPEGGGGQWNNRIEFRESRKWWTQPPKGIKAMKFKAITSVCTSGHFVTLYIYIPT